MIDYYSRVSSDFGTDLATLPFKLDAQFKHVTASKLPGYTHLCHVYKISNPKVIVSVDMVQNITRTGCLCQLLGIAPTKASFTAVITVEPSNQQISEFVKDFLARKLRGKSESSFSLIAV